MKYGLIGEKLGHSFSKTIHEKISDAEYKLRELSEKELESFMKEKAFEGINVTIPYKTKVIPYLDYIDEAARKIGAVNTIINREGKLYGYNTDFDGMKKLTQKIGFDYSDSKVLILGTGGTAATARAVAEFLGAESVINVGRSYGFSENYTDYENVYTLHGDADYIINTTPLGMYPDCESFAVDVSAFPKLKGVLDAVYNPIRTRLCQKAEACGVKSISGLYMLVAQAVAAAEKFTEGEISAEGKTDELYNEILKEKRNIVLIGMPGSGKTTLGKILSEKLCKAFVDTDEIIKEKYGDISEIFSQKGEIFFREKESEVIKEISIQNGLVIATGGGAILRKENVERLKQNGVLVFVDRPLSRIIPTDNRPLSKDTASLEKLFNERYEIYKSAADVIVSAEKSEEETALEIMEILK